MKKKFLCLFLGIWLCLFFSLPLYALDGTINADDNAELVRPTLEVTTVPTDAAAVAHNMSTNQTYYYHVNGNVLSNNDNEILSEPGWMPETHSIDGVIGDDNRELVSSNQLRESPFSAIAYLKVQFPNGNFYEGTAAMISPNVALTVAHNLYCSKYGGWATYVEITPAANGSVLFDPNPNAPYGSATATEIVISVPAFEDKSEADGVDCDWGVIRLNSNIGDNSGFLGFQCISNSLEALSVMISGYPGDLNEAMATINQYMHSGRISSDTSPQITASNNTTYESRLLTYRIDATTGQSGSPILYYNNGSYQIIGIHSKELKSFEVCYRNDGFGLTSQVFHFLLSYKNI